MNSSTWPRLPAALALARDSLLLLCEPAGDALSDPAETRLQTLQAACDAIVAYLAQHPCAADNERGIAQWWLPDMGVDVPLTVVRQALQGLLQRQVVTSTSLADGSEIFRAAPPAPADFSH